MYTQGNSYLTYPSFLTDITYSFNLNIKKNQSQKEFTNIKSFHKNRLTAVQFTLKSSTTSLLKNGGHAPLNEGNPGPELANNKVVAFNVFLCQFLH